MSKCVATAADPHLHYIIRYVERPGEKSAPRTMSLPSYKIPYIHKAGTGTHSYTLKHTCDNKPMPSRPMAVAEVPTVCSYTLHLCICMHIGRHSNLLCVCLHDCQERQSHANALRVCEYIRTYIHTYTHTRQRLAAVVSCLEAY